MRDGIPVTVLCGPLGAGKTTTVNHLLENNDGRSIAVLVNDMGSVNVDADLLSAGTELAADGGVAELSNGCICCERQDDLETEVARLASEREFESLVVEASGISEPAPIARLFTTGSRAAAAYDLDTMVTVVDAERFLAAFGDDDRVERETAPGDTDRPLSDLMVEQIEYADVVLLNKADLVDEADLDRAERLISELVPRATVYWTTHGRIDAGKILGTGLYDPGETGAGAGWQQGTSEHAHGHADSADHADGADHDQAHDHGHDHASPDEVYNVSSFVYNRRRPFHPERIRELFGDLPASVVRSKGVFWVAGRDEEALLVSQAGPNARVEVLGPWLASLPEIERDLYRSNRPDVEWDDEHGDRRTELVFIGQDIDEDALVTRLDDCLVTDEEWDEGVVDETFPTGDEESLAIRIR
ncbi:cobalamin biosynthesis protein CobW [Halobacteriales archaeon SW_7_65_23]|nr:MAG: cobalamin biosynthesis protein CobW [Halobacteriales archaeon SW_7_65_23]